MYVGMWEKNLKHGIGHESKINGGTRRKGEWKHGSRFRWLEKTQTVTGSVNKAKLPQEQQRELQTDNHFLEEIVEDVDQNT